MAIAARVHNSLRFESNPGLPRIFPYASTTTNGSTAGCSARKFSISLWNVRPYTSAHASTPPFGPPLPVRMRNRLAFLALQHRPGDAAPHAERDQRERIAHV